MAVNVGGMEVDDAVGGIDVNVGVITTNVGIGVDSGTISGAVTGTQAAKNKVRKVIKTRFIEKKYHCEATCCLKNSPH